MTSTTMHREQQPAVPDAPSKARLYLSTAERIPPSLDPVSSDSILNVQRVGVVGAGLMGSGIAMSFLNAGFPVTVLEVDQAGLDRGLATLHKAYAASVSKGKITEEQRHARMALLRSTIDYADMTDADLVVEAAVEDLSVKREIFCRLDQVCHPAAVLATNTSQLDVDAIAAAVRRPAAVLGMHFFSPANVMRLVEVVRGRDTGPAALHAVVDVSRRLGKLPVLVRNCVGFVGNRMVSPYGKEAEFLVEEGASPAEVDEALRGFGMAMGRFAMADLAGLDLAWRIRKSQPARPAGTRYCRIADALCELGRFGQKTKLGYFRYGEDGRTPIPDPAVDLIAQECAKAAGIVRRAITREEIVDRTVLALVNEGARILEERVVERASDIDLVYVNGYGFPAWRGGPMFYADTLGLRTVLAKIVELHAKHGQRWKPSPLLERLAAIDGCFADYAPA